MLALPPSPAERTEAPTCRQRQRFARPFGLALIVALPALGCASGKSSVQARVVELEAELGRVQRQGDRLEERLSALEYRLSQPSSTRDVEAEGGSDRRPELRVVRLAPGQEAPAQAEAEEPAPAVVEAQGERPTLSLRGNAGGAEPGGDAAGVRAQPDAASGEYQAALALVRNREFDSAISALSSFAERHPRHPYADNAAYWRGECHYALGDFEQAARQFQAVVERFPGGNKVPDALLKLGMSLSRLGDRKRAGASFAALARAYPSSTATSKIPSEYR